jgi:hypothetical protein
MKLLSTRARAELWRLQNAMRAAGKERDRLLRLLSSSRAALSGDAQRDICLEYACAEQEYRHTVMLLADFVRQHGGESSQPREAAGDDALRQGFVTEP